jgi:hypothetical protein
MFGSSFMRSNIASLHLKKKHIKYNGAQQYLRNISQLGTYVFFVCPVPKNISTGRVWCYLRIGIQNYTENHHNSHATAH